MDDKKANNFEWNQLRKPEISWHRFCRCTILVRNWKWLLAPGIWTKSIGKRMLKCVLEFIKLAQESSGRKTVDGKPGQISKFSKFRQLWKKFGLLGNPAVAYFFSDGLWFVSETKIRKRSKSSKGGFFEWFSSNGHPPTDKRPNECGRTKGTAPSQFRRSQPIRNEETPYDSTPTLANTTSTTTA